MFRLYPHGSLGFYHIPNETVQVIVNQLLGGVHYSTKMNAPYDPRELSSVDQTVLNQVIQKLFDILQIPFQNENRVIEFEMLDSDSASIQMQNIHDNELVSTQQFMIEVEGENYFFDLVLSNQFLEKFVSL